MSSTLTHKQMFQGVGAPVNVAQNDADHIDPTLDSCCQREIESNRKRNAVETALRAHDRVSHAENQRRQQQQQQYRQYHGGSDCNKSFNLLHGMTFGSDCRCCYDPNGDGGEYELLAQAKKERGDFDDTNYNCVDLEENDGGESRHSESGDSDSDREFDYLLDEDITSGSGGASAGYDDLQSHRRFELENIARHGEAARHHGYGVHRQMHPQRVFPSVGYGVDRVRDRVRPREAVLHLYDAYSPLSVSLDLCLEEMARRYMGTKFVRGVGTASLLYAEDGGNAEWKRGDLPMVLAVREGEVVAWSPGLRDFYNRGSRSEKEVESKVVEQWLDRAGVLVTNPPPMDELCNIRLEEELFLENGRKLNGLGGGDGSFGSMMRFMKEGEIGRKDEEDLEEDRYECGVSGCCKSFYHEHVGVKNESQDGLLVIGP